MAGRIPESFIDELMRRIDIVEVIDKRVQLKKAGRDFSACCPFHSEKTPSFTVSQSKQFYHCFGCGAHGSAIGFLMDYEHLSFLEAVEELAAAANLEIPREAAAAATGSDDVARLYEVMERAADFYRKQLRAHPESQRAVDYLKGRGLTGAIAADYGIGFAPPGWDNLVRAIGGDRQVLSRAGLAAEKSGGKFYDRFRDRIIFPIRDRRGRAIAFGGRILDGDGPKYLNSPETPIFHKGRELYGLFETRKAVRHLERLLVVEGYMDVVALAQHGIRYAVATLGTATTADHLKSLYRACPEVVFCFDGDRAGREAAWRALENALPVVGEGRHARFLFLPEGEDPDTLVRREGADAFEARIATAVPLSEFFFEAVGRGADTATMEGRDRLVAQARPLLAKLQDPVFRALMMQRLAAITGLESTRLESTLGLAQTPGPAPSARRQRTKGGRVRTLVQLAIALLLDQPSVAQEVEIAPALRRSPLPGVPLLIKLVEKLREGPHLTTGAIVEMWRDQPEHPHLLKLAQAELAGSPEQRRREFMDALVALGRGEADVEHRALSAREAAGGPADELKAQFIQFVRSVEAHKRGD